MNINTNENGWVVQTGFSIQNPDYVYDGEKDVEPLDPSRNKKAWKWVDGQPKFVDTRTNIKPKPEDVFSLYKQELVDHHGYTDEEAQRHIRAFDKEYGDFKMAVMGNDFDSAKLPIDDDQASNNPVLSSDQAQTLRDVLDGKAP